MSLDSENPGFYLTVVKSHAHYICYRCWQSLSLTITYFQNHLCGQQLCWQSLMLTVTYADSYLPVAPLVSNCQHKWLFYLQYKWTSFCTFHCRSSVRSARKIVDAEIKLAITRPPFPLLAHYGLHIHLIVEPKTNYCTELTKNLVIWQNWKSF